RDVTSSFAARVNGQILGVVSGLRVGPNVLAATLPGGRGARITITNHPKGGPVFSGPQVQPWVCGTASQGLGKPTDKKCDAPTKYSFECKSSSTGQFESYDPKTPPSDCAT